jgi:hypothetical protein
MESWLIFGVHVKDGDKIGKLPTFTLPIEGKSVEPLHETET